MKITTSLFTAGLLALFMGTAAAAETYPSKPVEIVLPYGGGGSGDLIARQLAKRFQERFGQPFVVIYKPGASGAIGADAVAKAKPDGYTLLLGYATEVILVPMLRSETKYTPKSFEPVAMAGTSALALVGRNDIPARNMRELVTYFQKSGQGSYASVGFGSPQNIAGELFNQSANVKLIQIPYKSGQNAIADLVGGRVDIYFAGVPGALGIIQADRMKAFAVTGSKRVQVLPEVESTTEAGFPEFDLSGWFALFAPAGTPPEIVAELQSATEEALQDKELQAVFAQSGIEAEMMSGPALRSFIDDETSKYQRLIKRLDIKSE